MPTIKFISEKKEIQVPEGANLRAEAKRAGVQVYQGPETVLNCHGFGTCGACRVKIVKGMENTSPRGWKERLRMSASMDYIGNEATMRLACQTEVLGDIEVETRPPINWFGENFFS
jgi:ferredoxin